MRSSLAGILLVALALSGCLGGGHPNSVVDGGAVDGSIVGRVTDDELVPLAGAEVELRTVSFSPLKLSATTPGDGSFQFVRVQPGKMTLTAHKVGYVDQVLTTRVVAGEPVEVRFQLKPAPSAAYRFVSLNPFDGKYECSAEWGLGGGSCDQELQTLAGQSAFQTVNNHTLELPRGWSGLLIELVWNATQETSTLDGIRFLLERPPNQTFARVESQGHVLRLTINQGHVHPSAPTKALLPIEGGRVNLHVVPVGQFGQDTCAAACLGGVGAALNLQYTIHPTLFYGGPVDPAYSAMTGG